ncbi:MAG: hypothetical protein AAB833_00760 [Patescibacteria group bacterium]
MLMIFGLILLFLAIVWGLLPLPAVKAARIPWLFLVEVGLLLIGIELGVAIWSGEGRFILSTLLNLPEINLDGWDYAFLLVAIGLSMIGSVAVSNPNKYQSKLLLNSEMTGEKLIWLVLIIGLITSSFLENDLAKFLLVQLIAICGLEGIARGGDGMDMAVVWRAFKLHMVAFLCLGGGLMTIYWPLDGVWSNDLSWILISVGILLELGWWPYTTWSEIGVIRSNRWISIIIPIWLQYSLISWWLAIMTKLGSLGWPTDHLRVIALVTFLIFLSVTIIVPWRNYKTKKTVLGEEIFYGDNFYGLDLRIASLSLGLAPLFALITGAISPIVILIFFHEWLLIGAYWFWIKSGISLVKIDNPKQYTRMRTAYLWCKLGLPGSLLGLIIILWWGTGITISVGAVWIWTIIWLIFLRLSLLAWFKDITKNKSPKKSLKQLSFNEDRSTNKIYAFIFWLLIGIDFGLMGALTTSEWWRL